MGSATNWPAYMTDLPPLPDGFVLDSAPAMPPLPDGFVLDAPQAAPRSAMDKLTGTGGERYQTWPERLARSIGGSIQSGVTLPHDVMTGQAQLPSSGAVPGSVPFGDANSSGQRVADLAMIANPTTPQAVRSLTKGAAPTVEELKAAATKGYESAEVKALEVKPQAVGEWAQATKAKLNADGFDDVVAKPTFDLLSKLEKAPDGSFVTGQSLESLRRTLGNAAKETGQNGQATASANAAKRAIDALDDFVPNIAAKDVRSGDPAAAAKIWAAARDNYAAAMRAEQIDRKTIQAELRAAAANSGMNIANTIRQRMADILLRPAERRGYSPDELKAMEKIVRGTRTENALRIGGNAMGGGLGIGAPIVGAASALASGSPLGAAVPLVGVALKALGNRLTMRQAERLSEQVRMRAPLAKSMEDFGAKASAFQQMSGPKTAAALMLSSRNLSNNLKDAGITLSPADIFKALQAPAKSAAEDNQ